MFKVAKLQRSHPSLQEHTMLVTRLSLSSGRLESLRKQTANRLQTELIDHGPKRTIQHITQSSDDIFKEQSGFVYNILKQNCQQRNAFSYPKDRRVLENMIQLFSKISSEISEFKSLPILIVDDESDEAESTLQKTIYK